jgi:hypothetical protein
MQLFLRLFLYNEATKLVTIDLMGYFNASLIYPMQTLCAFWFDLKKFITHHNSKRQLLAWFIFLQTSEVCYNLGG